VGGAAIAFEVGDGEERDVAQLLEEHTFTDVQVRADATGKPRVVSALCS
jgi:methylase of polypeptide subunit release factors